MTERPKFIGIGAAKSGTTSLHDILASHPQLFLPKKKELAFFCTNLNFEKGVSSYASHFKDSKNQICGEITPQYMYVPDAVNRVYNILGAETKIIIMLRNPADRAYSHYHHMRFRGQERLSFEEALKAEPLRLLEGFHSKMKYSYLDRGYYARQIQPWFTKFGANNIFTIVFEDEFRGEQFGNTLVKLQEFIGVDYVKLNQTAHSNQTKVASSPALNKFLYSQLPKARSFYTKVVPSQQLRRKFLDATTNFGSQKVKHLEAKTRAEIINLYYRDDIKMLESIIGRDLSLWQI